MKTYLIFYSTIVPALIIGILLLAISLIGNIISLFFGSPWSWMFMLVSFLAGMVYSIAKQLIKAAIRKSKSYMVPRYEQSPMEIEAFPDRLFGSSFGAIYCNLGLNFIRKVMLMFIN